ncbi:hypothetical protein AGMMS49975_05360 [Clostridia bacterium]|nr:hypothetical protein AGMMS49975_05360 [Clostridia bacterium]
MGDIITRILDLIDIHNITAKELTEKLHLNKTSISDWKSGRIKPSTEVLIRISQLFDIDLKWLLLQNFREMNKYQKREMLNESAMY